ncbi:related to Rpa34-34 kD subunit of DNA-directed RNA polymerase I [Sporisorium reilianum f. sp. reilianum]|uniref:Related to Rpa34-34 kD subunit of DNA-directed RNA polymerase I n=1 Tax=Sporisorium reilianum f. sp. reilianum TaxID=72559 RepID=A0A2N8U7N4_9BASI|nr:related to Rpa34-34 kD subunit of DNA-directed RNA polymerase I [Sporisorium reilianum f. sp. reilianum]
MSKRSRSDSESSSSSSSSGGSSVEAQTAAVSTTRLPASRNLSNIGYRPPRGFEPVSFSSSSPLVQKKLGASSQQQLWAVRIPAGLSPAQLDGVVIDLPRDTADVKTAAKPLGTIQVPTSSSVDAATFNFYASVPSALKGKVKKVQSSADSQLIAMASEVASVEEDASVASGQGAASELESLKLLVPAGSGDEAGKLVLAPVKVAKCIHLSIASPAETSKAEKVKETSNKFEEKKLPQQPWHLLKGNFKPAGAKGGVDSAPEPASQVAEDKKEKKRKVKSEDGSKSKKSKKE